MSRHSLSGVAPDEDSEPERFSAREWPAAFVFQVKSGLFERGLKLLRINEREVILEFLKGLEGSGGDIRLTPGRQLQNNGQRTAGRNQGDCVFQAAAGSGVLEYQRRVNQLHRREPAGVLREIYAMQLELQASAMTVLKRVQV